MACAARRAARVTNPKPNPNPDPNPNLNAQIDAACAEEDFELADELETEMRNLKAELRAAGEAQAALVGGGGGGR